MGGGRGRLCPRGVGHRKGTVPFCGLLRRQDHLYHHPAPPCGKRQQEKHRLLVHRVPWGCTTTGSMPGLGGGHGGRAGQCCSSSSKHWLRSDSKWATDTMHSSQSFCTGCHKRIPRISTWSCLHLLEEINAADLLTPVTGNFKKQSIRNVAVLQVNMKYCM